MTISRSPQPSPSTNGTTEVSDLRRPRAAFGTVVSAVLWLVAAGAFGQTLTLDFETFPGPDGQLGTGDDVPTPDCSVQPCAVADAYAALGLDFTVGTLLQGDTFPGTGPGNHYLSSSPPDVAVTPDVYGVSIRSHSRWTAVLYVLDADGGVLATDTLVNPSAGVSDHGGTLGVVTTEPIRRFTVRPLGCGIDEQCSQILNLDDLTISTEAGRCLPSSSRMCLQDGRFQVEVTWKDFAGFTDDAQVVPFGSADSGLFWFFEADNWEMLVKVLDACGVNGHFWVFSAATTNVEYTLRVVDTETGQSKEYFNALGNAAAALTDTSAFETCP
ncbi:MAG: hypothetical protein AAGN66_07800 [Acidobacteriota bacterium]